MPQNRKPLQVFLNEGPCLIVEPSKSFSANIQTALQQMGIQLSNAQVVRKFREAQQFIEEKKPKLLVTEYEIESRFGMELIEMQDKQHEQSNRISFITTKNASDSSVAEAAEGQVDGYLLKPFPMDTFQKKLTEILQQKLNPSGYLVKINAGKALLAQNNLDQAIDEFLSAKSLNEKPTLACSYAGQTFQAKGELARALIEFQEGRKYQPLHYKCLVGEFEALMTVKNYPEAYALVDPIRKNYPITSRRLGHMFVAAVFTGHFDDLPVFYDLFSRLDQRTPDLINISSVAMLTAGRLFIKQQNLKKALEYFEIGLMITGRNFGFLEKVVSEFLKIKSSGEAEAIFSKANPADIGTIEHTRLGFQIDQLSLPKEQMVEKGRQLIFADQGTPEIFKSVVQGMAELGKETLAESVISKATSKDPTLRTTLYQILAEHLPKKHE